MEMTQAREGAILQRAVDTYGATAQVDMMIEEMSELTKALLKYRQAAFAGADALGDYKSQIREEMADCYIMLGQMCFIYGDPTEWEISKLERLAERLGMEGFDGGAD